MNEEKSTVTVTKHGNTRSSMYDRRPGTTPDAVFGLHQARQPFIAGINPPPPPPPAPNKYLPEPFGCHRETAQRFVSFDILQFLRTVDTRLSNSTEMRPNFQQAFGSPPLSRHPSRFMRLLDRWLALLAAG